MKIASWAVSDASLLSSTAIKNAIKFFHFSKCWLYRLVGSSHVRLETMFGLRLTLLAFFLGIRDQAFFHKLFLNERMKDPIDFAISASAIKLAFGAASVYDVVFLNIVCCETKFLFFFSAFWHF